MPPAVSEHVAGPDPGAARIAPAGQVLGHLGVRRQVLIATYWFSLSYHGGAVFPVAVAAQVINLSPSGEQTAVLAVLGTLSGLIVTVVQPVAGACSDLTPSHWGRRRPYVLGGVLLDVVGLALMAWTRTLPGLFAGFQGEGVAIDMGHALAARRYGPDRLTLRAPLIRQGVEPDPPQPSVRELR